MADLLPPSYCWHCLHYLEWTTVAVIWDNSGVGHNTVPDFLMTTMATATGIGYGSERFNQLMETYGWVLVNTPVPPPLDHQQTYVVRDRRPVRSRRRRGLEFV
jgi:hypothetical protein